MAARNDASARRRRRELLRALLEEEEQEEQGLTEMDLLGLLNDLRAARAPRPAARSPLMSAEQLQGFIWGIGVATLLLTILPTAKQALRPFAVSAIKSALGLMDQLKALLGQSGEGLQDLVAEAQFERMQEAAAPDQPK